MSDLSLGALFATDAAGAGSTGALSGGAAGASPLSGILSGVKQSAQTAAPFVQMMQQQDKSQALPQAQGQHGNIGLQSQQVPMPAVQQPLAGPLSSGQNNDQQIQQLKKLLGIQ